VDTIQGNVAGKACYSVDEFCSAHVISRAMFYKLRANGRAPRQFGQCSKSAVVPARARSRLSSHRCRSLRMTLVSDHSPESGSFPPTGRPHLLHNAGGRSRAGLASPLKRFSPHGS
jgi:hypothetical protein